MGFPPPPAYPLAIDSNKTLFKVYNTTESRLSANNEAWAEVVEIVPVDPTKPEIWPDNGFATLSGEIIYYDSVELYCGRVCKLKGCARNMGGEHTQFNPAGTWIRGFIMAEHHNQMVDAIHAVEEFILDVTDKAEYLISETECIDDFDCPDVKFIFEPKTISGACIGTEVGYYVEIAGQYDSFRIEFGDGNSSELLSGSYTYPPNTEMNPVVVVGNDKCQIIQSHGISTPTFSVPSTGFTVPVPSLPELPPVICPECYNPDVPFNFPPIVFPCIDIGDISIPPWPSMFEFSMPPFNFDCSSLFGGGSGINFPSTIYISSSPISFPPMSFPEWPPISWPPISFPEWPIMSFPSFIGTSGFPPFIPTFIGVGGIDGFSIPPFIPSFIGVGGISGFSIPDTINITCCDIPSTIVIGGVGGGGFSIPTFIVIGTISNNSVVPFPNTITIECPPDCLPSSIGIGVAGPGGTVNPWPVAMSWWMSNENQWWFSYTGLLPSQITFGPAPTIPGTIGFGPVPSMPCLQVCWGTAPTLTVQIQCPTPSTSGTPFWVDNVDFEDSFEDFYPTVEANVDVTDLGIPSQIFIVAPEMPEIRIKHDIPTQIHLTSPEIPSIINITLEKPIPTQIEIIQQIPIPQSIFVVATDIPTIIHLQLDTDKFPCVINVVPAPNFPTNITIDGSSIPTVIQIKGLPNTIELKHNIPTEIMLRVPENIEVPLIYRGGPIPIQFDVKNLTGEGDDDAPCFALVPCARK